MPKRRGRKSRSPADLLFRSRGLFWPISTIDSGSRQLMGSRTRGGRTDPVNLWDQRGIYALYRDFNLVYAGQAVDRPLGVRLAEHLRDDREGRWDRFSWFGVKLETRGGFREGRGRFHVDSGVAINHIEGLLIEVAEPRLNSQGARWRKEVHRYYPLPSDGGPENGSGR